MTGWLTSLPRATPLVQCFQSTNRPWPFRSWLITLVILSAMHPMACKVLSWHFFSSSNSCFFNDSRITKKQNKIKTHQTLEHFPCRKNLYPTRKQLNIFFQKIFTVWVRRIALNLPDIILAIQLINIFYEFKNWWEVNKRFAWTVFGSMISDTQTCSVWEFALLEYNILQQTFLINSWN